MIMGREYILHQASTCPAMCILSITIDNWVISERWEYLKIWDTLICRYNYGPNLTKHICDSNCAHSLTGNANPKDWPWLHNWRPYKVRGLSINAEYESMVYEIARSDIIKLKLSWWVLHHWWYRVHVHAWTCSSMVQSDTMILLCPPAQLCFLLVIFEAPKQKRLARLPDANVYKMDVNVSHGLGQMKVGCNAYPFSSSWQKRSLSDFS